MDQLQSHRDEAQHHNSHREAVKKSKPGYTTTTTTTKRLQTGRKHSQTISDKELILGM